MDARAIESAEQRKLPVLVMATSAASAVWLFIALWLLSSDRACSADPGFWASHIACLTANDMGAFLSGAFAPLAFLWLVVAVIIQGQELAAQRIELSLTRKEYELTRHEVEGQRAALEAQVAEAHRNVEVMSGQSEILERNFARSEQIEATKIVDDLLAVAADLIGHGTVFLLRGLQNGAGQTWQWQLFISDGLEDFTSVKVFNTTLLRADSLIGDIRREMPTQRMGVEKMREVLVVYRMILGQRPQIASAKALQISLLKIEMAQARLEAIFAALGEPTE